jgi:hypothetical protein
MRLTDVLSPQEVPLLLDENFVDNGNWIPVVDGKVIPGVDVVTDEPPEIQLATLKQDSRTGPAARLGYSPDQDYMITLSVPTQQQSVIEACLGRGAVILDMAAANLNNIVGSPAKIAVAVSDALFGIFKVSGTTGDFDVTIPRMPHVDILADHEFKGSTVPGTAYDHCFSVWNPTNNTCSGATAPGGAAGTATWVDKFLGTVVLSSMSLPTQVFQYDPAESGIITIGGESVSVDPRLVDPDLRAGDWCVVIGVAYKYSQLTRAGDWQVTQPMDKPTRCAIDLYRSLSDTTEFRNWVRHRFYDCEQYNLPSHSTSGSQTDFNKVEYKFVVRPFNPRLGGAGRYYDKQLLVDDA